MSSFTAVLRKDLLLEVRGGQSTVALGALSLLVLVVLVFAFNPGGGERGAEAAAGALWVALVFAGMLGATRAVSAESENGCLRALLLSPLDRAALYTAKLAAAFIFMAVAEAAVDHSDGAVLQSGVRRPRDAPGARGAARRARLRRARDAAGKHFLAHCAGATCCCRCWRCRCSCRRLSPGSRRVRRRWAARRWASLQCGSKCWSLSTSCSSPPVTCCSNMSRERSEAVVIMIVMIVLETFSA